MFPEVLKKGRERRVMKERREKGKTVESGDREDEKSKIETV